MHSNEFLIPWFHYDDDIIAATRLDRRPRVRVYRLSGIAVVLGRGSSPERELVLESCLKDRVSMLRRYGGGCSVVLDPGNVIVSVALQPAGVAGIRRHFDRLSDWLIRGLFSLGFQNVRREGVSDLAIGDRKIAGACFYAPRGFILYSATLLVEPRIELMERYLKHPPREPAYRRGRSHADFVGKLIGAGDSRTASSIALELQEILTRLRIEF
jgi:lipoate-protein ligase A